jgi:hypothetical protein
LRDYLGYRVSNAAGMSAVFPAVGAGYLFVLGRRAAAGAAT